MIQKARQTRNNRLLLTLFFLFSGHACDKMAHPPSPRTVPHEGNYGIYALNLSTSDINLIYSTTNEIHASALRLNSPGTTFVFTQKMDGNDNSSMEICTVNVDGTNFKRITKNSFWDLYPSWSPNDTKIAFLSQRDTDLDIYVMEADGSNEERLYDSGDHDADIDWRAGKITFTSDFKIWTVNDDGSDPQQVTNPPNAGQWGAANLPEGDYDPRFSPDGTKIVYERMEDTSVTHGGYNLFLVNLADGRETRLTSNGYSQGLASWSLLGDRLVYLVAAIEGVGKYDLYLMNADGTSSQNITPDYFPEDFLCHAPIFSQDDSTIYFIGQWWQ